MVPTLLGLNWVFTFTLAGEEREGKAGVIPRNLQRRLRSALSLFLSLSLSRSIRGSELLAAEHSGEVRSRGDTRVRGEGSLQIRAGGPVADERDPHVGGQRREDLSEHFEVLLCSEAPHIGEDDVGVARGADEPASLGGAKPEFFIVFLEWREERERETAFQRDGVGRVGGRRGRLPAPPPPPRCR